MVNSAGLRQREAGHRHSVRGATHVVDAEPGEEGERGRIAGVLAADADLESGVRGAAALDGGLDQFADALLVESDERVQLVKSLALVGGEECRGVVAGNAVGGLRQIVSAEREEIDMARNVGGAQCRAR